MRMHGDGSTRGSHECCWHHDMLRGPDVACCACCHCGAPRWPADGMEVESVERDEQGRIIGVYRRSARRGLE